MTDIEKICEECGMICDAWEAQYCCALCYADDNFDDSRCELCNREDI